MDNNYKCNNYYNTSYSSDIDDTNNSNNPDSQDLNNLSDGTNTTHDANSSSIQSENAVNSNLKVNNSHFSSVPINNSSNLPSPEKDNPRNNGDKPSLMWPLPTFPPRNTTIGSLFSDLIFKRRRETSKNKSDHDESTGEKLESDSTNFENCQYGFGTSSSDGQEQVNDNNCNTMKSGMLESKFESDPQISDKNKREAESCKALGNENFRKGFIQTAIMNYSEAIELNPVESSYWTNRALCYKNICDWQKVVEDSRMALNLDDESVKAHYFLGLGLIHLGDINEGLKKLTKAKTLSALRKSKFEDEIDNTILKMKKMIWSNNSVTKLNQRIELQDFLSSILTELKNKGEVLPENYEKKILQIEDLFKDANSLYQQFTIPEFLCCKISMGLMNDPVCTPSGQTYERLLIEEHLKRNGEFDPLSRKPCKIGDLIPNYAIKEAIKYFLDRYPWIYED